MSILYKSAFAIADMIRAGEISSREVVEFYLQRIERFNPTLNVVVALDADRALVRADAADKALASGELTGPLHGVPITIKDAFCTEGLVSTGGIPDCADYVPKTNAIAVQRYVDAGAIVFGKTNVPFMSSDLQSYNEIYGTSNNPWNTERTCGGSSGGAAAAVAAGLTPLEIGSDIGGSIRTPCHFNGVYGHKSSYGLVPQRGHLPGGERALTETDLAVVGPIGSCVEDLERSMLLLAGPLPEDAGAWQLNLLKPGHKDPTKLRVAVWSDDPFCPVDKDVRRCVEAAGDSLQQLGAQVDHCARPAFDPLENHYNYIQLLMSAMAGGMPDSLYETAAAMVASAEVGDMSEPLLQMRGIALSHRDWIKRNEKRLHSRAAWAKFFEDYDVLLCPCANVAAFAHDHQPNVHQRRLAVNGEQRPYNELMGWAGLTLNAYLPATAVPAGLTGEGLPVGVQVVAPYLGDMTSLMVAGLLEQHHRGFEPPPGYA